MLRMFSNARFGESCPFGGWSLLGGEEQKFRSLYFQQVGEKGKGGKTENFQEREELGSEGKRTEGLFPVQKKGVASTKRKVQDLIYELP